VVKKKKVNDDNVDDIDTFGYYEDIESEESIFDGFDARRRLEQVLEDKALERLINGDFYDDYYD
jgi:hypothetical protein